MGIKPFKREVEVLSAEGTTGAGVTVNVKDFRYASIQLAGDNTSVLTVKIQGSLSSTPPDFDAAQSVTNQWDYINIIDSEDGSLIAGDAGIAFSADDVRIAELNVDRINWVTLNITARTTGDLTGLLVASTEV